MPSTPQEMLDYTILAFELTFKYRNPVIILADGYLGQMTGKVQLPDNMVKPGIPAVGGLRRPEPPREPHHLHPAPESDLEKHTSTWTTSTSP